MSANLLIEILEMNSNPFIDRLIRERRSQRGFLEQPVAIGIVKGVFSIASHAPSTGNAQPWRCHVATGEALYCA
jgi:nitrobenzene nitroreductase